MELSEIVKSNENSETLTKKINEFGERVAKAQISSYVKVFTNFVVLLLIFIFLSSSGIIFTKFFHILLIVGEFT